jgi:hypothetical protein
VEADEIATAPSNGLAMTERSLHEFFDTLRSAQQANRAKFPVWYDLIERTDRCFVRAGKNLVKLQSPMTGAFLLRCQYAFKTAAGMALAGQVVEAFVMPRSVLEYAGYALLICKTPSLEGVFLGRHTSEKAKKTQKEAFKIGTVNVAVRRCDRMLADIFVENYERSIDFGGHPNPNAAFSASVLDERNGESGMTVLPMVTEPKIVIFGLKCTAQVGLTALCVLQYVFKEKFELLGINQEIDALKNAGML